MTLVLGVPDADEFTHEPVDNRAWRESYFFELIDARSGLGVIAYAGALPVAGVGYGMVHVADRTGVRFTWNEHGFPLDDYRPGLADLRIGPSKVELDEVHRRQSLRFSGEGASLDLKFTANAPVYDYPWWEQTRSRHYEQLGTGQATIRLPGGEELAIRGGACRDHAWGLRSLHPFTRWFWMTFRSADTSWTLCWKETNGDRTDVYGYLVDADGSTAIADSVTTDLRFVDDCPAGGVMTVTFGDRPPAELHFVTYGLMNVSHRDPAKPGPYFFTFYEGDFAGQRGCGVFDVFWRSELGVPAQVQARRG
jgi:hypothetical protein